MKLITMDFDVLNLLIVIVMVGYVIALVYVTKLRRIRINERKKDFVKVLIRGFENETISTLDDVLNLYAGMPQFISVKIDRSIINRHLKELLVLLATKNKEYIDVKMDGAKILEWKQKITDFIKKNDEISPYSELPEIEKNMLYDILAFVDKTDPDSIKRKILELSNMIKIRNNEFKKSQSKNNVSIIFAVVGTIFTFIFGILALQ